MYFRFPPTIGDVLMNMPKTRQQGKKAEHNIEKSKLNCRNDNQNRTMTTRIKEDKKEVKTKNCFVKIKACRLTYFFAKKFKKKT
jgi:hypothetical protein